PGRPDLRPDERHGHGHHRPHRPADGRLEDRAPGPAKPALRLRRVRRTVPAAVRLRAALNSSAGARLRPPASVARLRPGYGGGQRKTPAVWAGVLGIKPLAMTYSCMAGATLPLAQLRFTSEFGMGSGGSTALWSPGKGWRVARVRAASHGVGSSEVWACWTCRKVQGVLRLYGQAARIISTG